MFNTRKTIAIFAAFVFLLGGCDGLLDTEPRQSISPEVALANIEGLQAIVAGAYNRLQDPNLYGQRLTLAPDALADNAKLGPNPSGRMQSELVSATGAGIGSTNQYYRNYQLINEANYVITGVDQTDAPQSTRDRLQGEAYFLRALAYHNLARVYSYEPGREVNGWDRGVIIRLEPVAGLTEADLRSRSSNSAVYDQIESDLMAAINLLSEAGGTARTRATAAAAEALLARVYLYEGNWSGAADYATRAMANTTATLAGPDAIVGSYGAGVNPEAVLQLSIAVTEVVDGRNEGLAALVRPRPNHWGDLVPSDELIALYEEDDVRLGLFDEIDGTLYTNKYNSHVDAYADNVPVIRYAELLLIRAEALAEQNDIAGAVADLNTLREARNASQLDLGSQAQVIDAIMAERRRELNFEGHRFFDLKRRGMNITKAAATNTATVSYDDRRVLMPLPTREVDLNENLEQNPGY